MRSAFFPVIACALYFVLGFCVSSKNHGDELETCHYDLAGQRNQIRELDSELRGAKLLIESRGLPGLAPPVVPAVAPAEPSALASAPVPVSEAPASAVPAVQTVASVVNTPVEPQPEAFDEAQLQECLNLPCEIGKQGWETQGFTNRAVNLLREKYTLMSKQRQKCESVLSQVSESKKKARNQLQCLRTLHREVECALVRWNTPTAVLLDVNGRMLSRSAVAVNVLFDFAASSVRAPTEIHQCVSEEDLRKRYGQLVQGELTWYQQHLADEPARDITFEQSFCAEQHRDVSKLPLMAPFNRGTMPEGFVFPEVMVNQTTISCDNGEKVVALSTN